MYLEHFGLTEAPFKITPHTEFFFTGAKRGETLDALIYAIMAGEGIVKVTGEVGAGKTMLCRVLMERLPDSVETIYLAVPTLTRDEMLAVIASDLHIESQGVSTTKLIRALQEQLIEMHAQGKQVVALIDEAHAMPLLTLEELRLLSNLETSQHKLLQIVMFGQEELNQHLLLPSMRQLKERITHSFNLMPLPATDIKDYLSFRLRAAGYKGPDLFTADALKLLSDASEGLTRRINIYADKTLLAAFAENTHTVTAAHVRAAIRDTQIISTAPKKSRQLWLIAAALLIGLCVGAAVVAYLTSTPQAATATPVAAAVATAPPVIETPKPNPDAVSAVQNEVENINAEKSSTTIAATAPIPATSTATPTPPTEKTAPLHETKLDVTPPASKPSVISPPAKSIPAATVNNVDAPILDWSSNRIATDRDRLAAIADNHYTVQLMIAEQDKNKAIEEFWNEAKRELGVENLMMYPHKAEQRASVSVIYGDFENIEMANQALNALSTRLKKFHPYARSFKAIRKDTRP